MTNPADIGFVGVILVILFVTLAIGIAAKLRTAHLRSWRRRDWLKAIGWALFAALMAYALFVGLAGCSAYPEACGFGP